MRSEKATFVGHANRAARYGFAHEFQLVLFYLKADLDHLYASYIASLDMQLYMSTPILYLSDRGGRTVLGMVIAFCSSAVGFPVNE